MTTSRSTPRRRLSAPLRLEIGAITSLFPLVAATTIVLLVVFVYLRGPEGSKIWDRAAFVASVATMILLALRFLLRPKVAPNRLALAIGVGGMLWGVVRIEHHPSGAIFWQGFGISVALVAILLAPLILPLSFRVRRSRLLAIALTVPALILGVIDLISLIRDFDDFANASNNMFVLNELLAPSAGRVPDATFIPQYTTLLGWTVVPFRHLLSAHAFANFVAIVLSCMSVAAVVLAVVLARGSLPKRSLWLAVSLTIPLTTVTVFHNGVNSSIGSFLQELPVRMFPAMLYSLIAVDSIVGILRKSVRKPVMILLGVLAGLMAWNSQDFGIAVALTYGVLLQVASRGDIRKRATVLWLAGLVPGLLVYPLWALGAGTPIKFNNLALTARSFSNGFASSPIQIPGPVLLVLPVILGSVAVGVSLLWRSARGWSAPERFQQRAVVTLAFVGVWSMIGFVYYLNRSYASGQLQLFLLPLGVCLCALLSLCSTAMSTGREQLESLRPRRHWGRVGRAVWLLPVTLPVAVGFGAMLQTPSLAISLHNLRRPPASSGLPSTFSGKQVSLALAYTRDHGGGAVGYFGPDANYLELATGIKPVILYDDPSDFLLGQTASRLGCDYLRDNATKWLLVEQGSTQLLGSDICGEYKGVSVSGEPPRTVFMQMNTHVRGS